MSVAAQEKARWIALTKSNQPIAKASCFHTLATSTTPTDSPAVSGSFILIAAAGADHLVSFDGPASTESAVVPQGAVMNFEIEDVPNGTTVSVRTISGSGYCTIYHAASETGDITSWMV